EALLQIAGTFFRDRFPDVEHPERLLTTLKLGNHQRVGVGFGVPIETFQVFMKGLLIRLGTVIIMLVGESVPRPATAVLTENEVVFKVRHRKRNTGGQQASPPWEWLRNPTDPSYCQPPRGCSTSSYRRYRCGENLNSRYRMKKRCGAFPSRVCRVKYQADNAGSPRNLAR